MNCNEAKTILLLYRHGTADAEDPQFAEALRLAGQDAGLAGWLARHRTHQLAVRGSFRQIPVPAGLKEQIISEHAAQQRMSFWRRKLALPTVAALGLLTALAAFWLAQREPVENTLAIYQNRMAGVALRDYAMDVVTNDPAAIRTYLAQKHAPADFVLPAPLQQTALTGCAVEEWQGVKVAMICFRTGHPLAPGTASDLWLFVVDRAAVKQSLAGVTPQVAQVNRLITATWIQGDKLYMLGTEGDTAVIRQYL